jgi:hypothetical protein
MLSDPLGVLRDAFHVLGQHPVVMIIVVLVALFYILGVYRQDNSGKSD